MLLKIWRRAHEYHHEHYRILQCIYLSISQRYGTRTLGYARKAARTRKN